MDSQLCLIMAFTGCGGPSDSGNEGGQKVADMDEMMASDITGGTNVIVMVEKLPLENMTMEQYSGELRKQLQAAGMGYVVKDEATTTTFVGQEYTTLRRVRGKHHRACLRAVQKKSGWKFNSKPPALQLHIFKCIFIVFRFN